MQFTKKTVSVRRWDDDGAPQLGYQLAGSLKTVLKAALVTGYSDKPGLGWEVLFEDEETDRIALRSSDPSSTQSVLYIDDSADRNYTAIVRAYESMSDIDNGVGQFDYSNAQRRNLFIRSSATANENARWLIVGHASTFVLVVQQNSERNASYIVFGDAPSFLPGDQYNAIFISNFENTDRSSVYYYSSCWPVHPQGAPFSISRAANQVDKNINIEKTNLNHRDGDYPDPISGGWCCEPILLVEKINNKSGYRCQVPGVYATFNFKQSDAFEFGSLMPATDDTDNYIWCGIQSGSNTAGVVINTTSWVAL